MTMRWTKMQIWGLLGDLNLFLFACSHRSSSSFSFARVARNNHQEPRNCNSVNFCPIWTFYASKQLRIWRWCQKSMYFRQFSLSRFKTPLSTRYPSFHFKKSTPSAPRSVWSALVISQKLMTWGLEIDYQLGDRSHAQVSLYESSFFLKRFCDIECIQPDFTTLSKDRCERG